MTTSPTDQPYQKQCYTVTIYVDGVEQVHESLLAFDVDVAIMKVCAAVLLDMLGLDLINCDRKDYPHEDPSRKSRQSGTIHPQSGNNG